MVWWVALAAVVSCAPSALAPPSVAPEHAAARRTDHHVNTPPRSGAAFGFPVFGRSELRLLISKRLKLVLDYRPTAFC